METRLFIQGVNLKEDQAWKELYNYFYAPLCCYSARLIGDEDAAEDIVQGCLLRLWRSSQATKPFSQFVVDDYEDKTCIH